MMWSRVAGTGSYLPARRLSNADLASRMDTSDEWIQSRSGIRQRHIADDTQSSVDLAFEASKAALESAGVNAEAIDLVIVATCTPGQILPSSACLLQARLGIKGGAAFDVQAACSGFIYALSIADKFIRSGQSSCALVVGAEVLSGIVDWNDPATAVLFGDGAGAVVLQASDTPGVLGSSLHADGSQAEILSVPATVRCGDVVGDPFVRMDGKRVFKFAVRALVEVARDTVAQCGLQMSDVDWLIPHQANIRILEATAERLGISGDRVVVTVDNHSNTSAASVPLAFDLALRDGRIKRGETVLMEGVGSGFTWGALLLRY